MRRLIAAVALLALAGCGGGSGKAATIQVKVDKTPFRITLLRDGKPVVAEDMDARLRYQLNGTGVQHSLTNLISSHGDVYRVATNEPGRTATVTVAATPTGARIDVAIQPASGIALVIDAFDTKPQEHFLGGHARGALAGQLGVLSTQKWGQLVIAAANRHDEISDRVGQYPELALGALRSGNL